MEKICFWAITLFGLSILLNGCKTEQDVKEIKVYKIEGLWYAEINSEDGNETKYYEVIFYNSTEVNCSEEAGIHKFSYSMEGNKMITPKNKDFDNMNFDFKIEFIDSLTFKRSYIINREQDLNHHLPDVYYQKITTDSLSFEKIVYGDSIEVNRWINNYNIRRYAFLMELLGGDDE
jgi:hypothetical protein